MQHCLQSREYVVDPAKEPDTQSNWWLTWLSKLGIRPADRVLLPTWMMPLRNVPVVMTTLLHVIVSPACNTVLLEMLELAQQEAPLGH